MNLHGRAPGGAALPLLHWLVLLSGLAALLGLQIDDAESALSIGFGAVAGTALGQVCAWGRLRPWVTAFLTANAIWVGALVFWPLVYDVVEPGLILKAYLPAVLCGYLSLSERGTLVAFWFPSVPWSLVILELDAAGLATASSDTSTSGAILLGVLGLLLLGTLWARETRRLASWKTVATTPLAPPGAQTTLREAPLRGLGRFAAVVFLGVTVTTITASIAPFLRQREQADAATGRDPEGTTAKAPANGAASPTGATPCCPEAHADPSKDERVREYFDVTPTRAPRTMKPSLVACVPCRDGAPLAGSEWGTAGTGDQTGREQAHDGDDGSAAGHSRGPGAAPTEAPVGGLPPGAPTHPGTPMAAARAHPELSTATAAGPRPSFGAHGSPAEGDRRRAPVAEAYAGGLPLGQVLGTSLGLLALYLALRPLRRWITLRHLVKPYWNESVGQRVSNLWQLAMVGLHDAGWQTVPGEAPSALARRVGLEGLAVCAAILERARHGVRVDAADLAAMEAAARSVYATARARAGWMARVAAAWRSPVG